MAKFEDVNSVDLLPNSRKMMLAALLQRMNQPQSSPWGAAANALSMGLLGLMEGQGETQALDTAKANTSVLEKSLGPSSAPAVAPPPPTTPPIGGGYSMPSSFDKNELSPIDAQVATSPELKVALAERLKQDPGAIDKGIRTIIGEAAGEPPVGQQAVGNVILNRSADKAMPLDRVVTAPNQFEPWSRADARARMSVPETSPQYTNAARALFAATDADPTGGATHFYSPGVQADLGRKPPAWDNGTGQMIGSQRFFQNPDRPQQVAQAQLPANPLVDLYRQQIAVAEAKGDRRAALKAYEGLQGAIVGDYAERRKFELERLGKREPTYSDLHPDLDIREAPDGSGKLLVFNKKEGSLVREIAPPTSGTEGIRMPDGRFVQPPPGLSGDALKAWRNKVAQEAGAAGAGSLTESQANSQSFGNRMEVAEPIIRKYSGAAQSLKDAMISNSPVGQQFATYGLSEQYQQLRAAKSAFITGLLRKESGATIQPSEFEMYDRAFFPQPGEPPSVVKQKEEMRSFVIDAMKKGAGPGYTGPGQPQQQGNVAPEGTVVHGRNGETLVKRNGQWVSQ